MHRIAVPGDAYLCTDLPASQAGVTMEDAVRRLAASVSSPGDLPAALTWNLRLHSRLGEAVVRIGDGAVDDLLLSQFDAGAACAVLETTLQRLRQRGAISALEQTGEALAVLARDPKVRIQALAGFTSAIRDEGAATKARRLRPGAAPSLISVAVLIQGEATRLDGFIDRLADQQLTSAMELLVVASGLSTPDSRALGRAVEERRTRAGSPRIRLFTLAGEMSQAMLANTAVTLASGEIVVLADPRCAPGAPQTVQSLASWAALADTMTACPRILDGAANQLAAGLGLTDAGEGAALAAWTSPALSGLIRRTAAPTPWFFVVNRAAWLACNGADPRRTGLWTAGLAEAPQPDAPQPRHLLVGPATAVWLEPRPPQALQSQAPVHQPSAESRRAARLVDAGSAVARALAPPKLVQSSTASFSDPFPTAAALRLLVFADGYGASQSIAFVEGLSRSRNGGAAAVRIVEEAAFGADGPSFDAAHAEALVRSHLEETRATVVVLSRFGHARAYEAILQALGETPVALVCHLDDDLFDLPICVGVERYRIARHPWRIQALHRGLAEAELVLAATDALASCLAEPAGPSRIASIHPGTAGEARQRQQPKGADAPLVIGYMASASHNHDLEMIAPALNALLARFDHVSLDLFGSISDQPAADLLRGRVRRLKPVTGDYWMFKRTLGELGWDIGLAPLRPIPYNLCKTPTKWAEYAEAGIATVASEVEVYREMITAQAAVPARPEEWEGAVARLIISPWLRGQTIGAADRLLRDRFGWSRLEARLLGAFDRLQPARLAAE